MDKTPKKGVNILFNLVLYYFSEYLYLQKTNNLEKS